MRHHGHVACLLILVALAAQAASLDQSGYLDFDNAADSAAANQDIKETMGGEELFSPGQDVRGSATPVMTGKNTPAASVNAESPQPKSRLVSPLSNWHLDLQDSLDRSIDIGMCQSNDAVFGKGTMVVENIAQNVTATGTIEGNKLSLDILSSDLSLFRLELTMRGKSLSGDYHAFSASFVPWTGIAMGSIQA